MDNNSQSVAVEQTTAAAKKTRRRRKAKRTLPVASLWRLACPVRASWLLP